ncbi:MAG: hypothetical protein Q8R04_03895 [Nanoarchaeota archaeon]|nr:hypothetical protein [Nanoarchaeota archaeon]
MTTGQRIYVTNVNLSSILTSKSYELGFDIPKLRDNNYVEKTIAERDRKVSPKTDSFTMQEEIANIKNGLIRLVTAYRGDRIKHQTIILLMERNWLMYSYSNETGEGKLTSKSAENEMEPEKGIEYILKIANI